MQNSADLLVAPWALLPDRLPFVRTGLNGASIRRRQASQPAPIASTTRRQLGTSALAIMPFHEHNIAVYRRVWRGAWLAEPLAFHAGISCRTRR